MISKTFSPFVPSPSPGTDAIHSAGVQDQLRRGRVGEVTSKDDLAPAERSKGEDPVGDVMDTHDAASQPTKEESPVITPKDTKTIDGEGNLTDAAAEVSSLEGGDTPGAADGGDAGGSAVGMDKNYQAPGPDSPNTQDPLTLQVDAVAPSDPETALRAPTGISPEIGGRQTEDEGSAI